MKILSLIAVLTALVLSSCNSTTEPGGNNLTDVIMPLKVGNLWVYDYIEFDSTGATIATGTDSLGVVGQVTIGGSTWYLFSNFSSDTTSVQNRKDGIYSVFEGKEWHVYLYPTKPGDRLYTRNDTVDDGDRVILEYTDVETINSSVTVPAGTFSCVKYVNRQEEHTLSTGYVWTPPSRTVDYVAPNKGLVQLTRYTRDRSTSPEYESYRRTLKSITLK
jgi:hypothetical protein